MSEVARVPQLRFPEFSNEWEKNKLGNLAVIKSGISPSKYELKTTGSLPFLKVEDLNNCRKYQFNSRVYSESLKNSINKNSVIFPKRGAAIRLNKVRINKVAALMDSNLMALLPNTELLNTEFLYYKIMLDGLYKIADTSTIPQINNKHILPYKLNLPILPEQQKIAAFLTAVDNKIEQLSKKQELLGEYKKGLMQQIFSQAIRFKADDGSEFPDWEEKNGNEIFDNISNKNHDSDLPILAITQEHGAIPRDLINYKMTVSDKSVSSYKVVETGDFIISLRSFQGGIEYSNYKGICSPAYIILRPAIEIEKKFYKYYLKTYRYIQDLNRKLEGIRDGKMVSYKYFSEIKLPYPSISEQAKIANFLSSIDNKIEQVGKQLRESKQFKKALLQQMFV